MQSITFLTFSWLLYKRVNEAIELNVIMFVNELTLLLFTLLCYFFVYSTASHHYQSLIGKNINLLTLGWMLVGLIFLAILFSLFTALALTIRDACNKRNKKRKVREEKKVQPRTEVELAPHRKKTKEENKEEVKKFNL